MNDLIALGKVLIKDHFFPSKIMAKKGDNMENLSAIGDWLFFSAAWV